MMSTVNFANEQIFVILFAKLIEELITLEKESIKTIQAETLKALTCFRNQEEKTIRNMFSYLSTICMISPKPIVLMIDKVDSASNNQVLIDFFAQLRRYFLIGKTSNFSFGYFCRNI